MIISTTHQIEGKKISRYCGLVSGEAIMGTNIFRDFMSEVSDIVGGRAAGYERKFEVARQTALQIMTERARKYGASAVVGVSLSYQVVGDRGSMLMVTTAGTAVVFEDDLSATAVSQGLNRNKQFLARIADRELGPFDESEIAGLYAEGTVTDDTLASVIDENGHKEWKPLGQLLG